MNARQYSEALVRKDKRIAELEAENRRLRNCENCAFCLEAGEGEPCLSCVAQKDDTPSQWAPVDPS